MTWQDWLLGTGGFFFTAALWPIIRNRAERVPARTSVSTAVILSAYVVAEASLGLWLGATGGIILAAGWWFIAWRRR